MNKKVFDLQRFLNVQADYYETALHEIQNGRKTSHWIWFIFPQIKGLGRSSTSEYYGIDGLEEAKAYLANANLKSHLLEISEALLECDNDIDHIFGFPDNKKVCSCMTLFKAADPSIDVFQKVLDKFYNGKECKKTLAILSNTDYIGQKPSRDRMVTVFKDTLNMINSSNILKKLVEKSQSETVFYSAECEIKLSENPGYEQKVSVTMHRTFEAAKNLLNKYPNERIAVLNFASATNPGGGVVNGARAQEESLCRCSTLYPCLNQEYLLDNYYGFHRNNHNFRYSDACIYTPDIKVIKTDTNVPERMETQQWFNVDVITCAAPNLRRSPSLVSSEEQYDIHYKRAVKILSAAIKGGAAVLVLGAFGCGAFHNDPKAVAKAYKDALKKFFGYFKAVEFAVFCGSAESENYKAFFEEFR